ncbi:MAG: hypothetical protein IIA44_09735 [Acidobacteria bacterium]|nr:hypothetical protein [Acidobacteriota bacterium]
MRRLPTLVKYVRNTTTWCVASSTESHAFAVLTALEPAPGDGQFLIRTRFVSVDPYMRGRMNEQRGYADPFEIGKAIYGGAVGEIVESNPPKEFFDNPKNERTKLFLSQILSH